MSHPHSTKRPTRIAVAAVLAGTMLTGCASLGLGGEHSLAAAQTPSATAKAAKIAVKTAERAVRSAEAQVLASPRDPQLRAVLGGSYLKAGRLVSARESLADAVVLGDESPRTALMLALAQIGTGQPRLALQTIEAQGLAIAAADRGLALALAGETGRGVQILVDAIRQGGNDVRTRQNLAYAFALDGRWGEARLMAAQDVAADRLDARITGWAMTARPEQAAERVAGLLDTKALTADPGQPAQLALANFPEPAVLAQAVPAMVAVPAPTAAIRAAPQSAAPPPAAIERAAVAPSSVAAAAVPEPAEPALRAAPPKLAKTNAPVPRPVASVPVTALPRTASRAPATSLPAPVAGGSHVAQLGSFVSVAQARAAWDIYRARHTNLADAQPLITTAVVNGRDYFRVSAGGFAAADAAAMCRAVQAKGYGCLPIARARAGTPVAAKLQVARAD